MSQFNIIARKPAISVAVVSQSHIIGSNHGSTLLSTAAGRRSQLKAVLELLHGSAISGGYASRTAASDGRGHIDGTPHRRQDRPGSRHDVHIWLGRRHGMLRWPLPEFVPPSPPVVGDRPA